ncbi:GH36 C-terminal domain-containing protein [Streptomyces cyaneofuscatus]|uniref:GH36 C-terminal domain-containing protein n=1 Tax=Streptomyces cyaneofuscatus TaxID=66883 RepID=UPI003F4CED31
MPREAGVGDWALGRLLRTVDEFAVDFLKWDFNRSFTEAGSVGRRPRRALAGGGTGRGGGEAVVLQWWAGPADRVQAPRLRLRGLDPRAVYRVDDGGGTLTAGTVRSGAALAAHGLPAQLPPGDHASRMLTLRRAG